MRGGQKMSVFVNAQGIKTVKGEQNSVDVVVECPQSISGKNIGLSQVISTYSKRTNMNFREIAIPEFVRNG